MKTRLAAFTATLVILLGGGVAAGKLINPSPPRSSDPKGMTAMSGKSEHGAMAMAVRGLAVADNGLRLVLSTPNFSRGRTQQLRFRIVDDENRTVRDFDVEHTKRMHLIVVRRDLTGFQHVHPRQGENGEWTVPLRLDSAGSYRVFADFLHDGEATTLASDIRVDGASTLEPLPAPAREALSGDGYTVRLDEQKVRAGVEAALRFTVLRDGQPIRVQPYLDANGHLVALRDGDLAFLHVHPTNGVEFESTFPTRGRYRLFLQFKHDGRVHTAAFTQEVI
jgi:hypothetical protein